VEELGLESVLREVLNQYAGLDLFSKLLNEGKNLGLIVAVLEAVVPYEVAKANAGHVSALAEGLTEAGLSRALGANNAGDLGQHSGAGCSPDLGSILSSVNCTDLSKFTVHLNDWLRGFVVVLNSLGDDLLGVVRAATGLGTFHATCYTDFFRNIEEEHTLAFGHSLLKLFGLINGSGETVDEIVLNYD
jgi:hypothetical protein